MDWLLGILYNHANGNWHPIAFRYYPHPMDAVRGRRYKSHGHHTDGFATRMQALAFNETQKARFAGEQTPVAVIERDFGWDGKDVPAIVGFFNVNRETGIAVHVL